MVSYNQKHNESNGENNQDGHNDNLSWNCGVEGPTKDPQINELRERQKRNFLATLILSQGVPMLLAGDEFGRTQRGNNNAYCQDNDISWVNWNLDASGKQLLRFTRQLIKLFHQHPALRRRKFFQGRKVRGSEAKDITWFRPDGKEMRPEDWKDSMVRAIGLRLAGDAISELDAHGNPIVDDTLFILMNAFHEPLPFVLPGSDDDQCWEQVFDTSDPARKSEPKLFLGGENYKVEARSLALLAVKDTSIKRKSDLKRTRIMSRLRTAFSNMLGTANDS